MSFYNGLVNFETKWGLLMFKAWRLKWTSYQNLEILNLNTTFIMGWRFLNGSILIFLGVIVCLHFPLDEKVKQNIK